MRASAARPSWPVRVNRIRSDRARGLPLRPGCHGFRKPLPPPVPRGAAEERNPTVPAELSDDLRKLIDDTPVFASIATIQPDGSPQVSVTWLARDGNDLLFSTTVGRRKEKNLSRDPRVTVLINPHNAPYTYAEVRGTAHLTTEGGQDLINQLSRKYTGKEYADFNPSSANDNERVVVRITPRKVVGSL